jgi:hypothetical protein
MFTDPYAKENLVHNFTRYFLKAHFNITFTSTNVSNKYTSLQIKPRLLLKPEIISYEYITEEIGLYAKFCVRVCIKTFGWVHCVPFPNISVQPNLTHNTTDVIMYRRTTRS